MSCFCALTTLKSFAMPFFSYRFADEGFLPVAAEGFVPLTAEAGSLPVPVEKEDLLVMMAVAGNEDLASLEILPRHHRL
jgi:hypothetical protein